MAHSAQRRDKVPMQQVCLSVPLTTCDHNHYPPRRSRLFQRYVHSNTDGIRVMHWHFICRSTRALMNVCASMQAAPESVDCEPASSSPTTCVTQVRSTAAWQECTLKGSPLRGSGGYVQGSAEGHQAAKRPRHLASAVCRKKAYTAPDTHFPCKSSRWHG